MSIENQTSTSSIEPKNLKQSSVLTNSTILRSDELLANLERRYPASKYHYYGKFLDKAKPNLVPMITEEKFNEIANADSTQTNVDDHNNSVDKPKPIYSVLTNETNCS